MKIWICTPKRKSCCGLPTQSSWRARPLICPNCSFNCANLKSMTRIGDRQAPHRSLYRLSFSDAARFQRRLQRSARPIVAAGVYHAQTLARTFGPGITARQHLSDNLNAVSNQTRSLIHQVQLRFILQGGLDDFQKCFIDSTAVEANTERPTDSSILVRLITRVCTAGSNLHRVDLPDMNQIGLLEQQEELRRLSSRFISSMAKREEKPSARSCISSYCGECAGCANVCCAIWNRFVATLRGAPICHRVGD